MGRIHPDAEFAYFSKHPDYRELLRPLLTCFDVTRGFTKAPLPAVSSAMDLLVELGIARELTGKRRNRLFVYDRYLSILNEGMEPP